MKKIFNCFFIELKLLKRNYIGLIAVVLSFLYVAIHFYGRGMGPGDALASTAFIVQGGILVSMVLGVYLWSREEKSFSEEVFSSIYKGQVSKIIGKVLTIFFVDFLYCFVCYIILSLFYFKEGAPYIFYGKAILYILLYWFLPFLISGIIGVFLRILIKSKAIYPVLVVIWIFIGPLNGEVIKFINTLLGEVDLTAIQKFLNLGQWEPNILFNGAYGFPMEIYRWLQKSIWLTFSLFLLLLAFHRNSPNKKGKLIIVAGFLFIIIPQVYFINKDSQLIFNKVGKNSLQKRDPYYYEKESRPFFEDKDNFKIQAYDIKVKSYRNLKVQASILIKGEREEKDIVFTLYRDLKVKSIKDKDGKPLMFSQKGDQVMVSLNAPLKKEELNTLVFNYEGISSPYFYANEQAVNLPAYFPWLPKEGAYQCMKSDGSYTYRYPIYTKGTVKYTLSYSGPEPVFTNLEGRGENIYSGEVSEGVTLAAGMLEKIKINDTEIYYPQSLYKIKKDFHKVLSYIEEGEKISRELMGLKENNKVKKLFIISIPREEMFQLTIWQMKDYIIMSSDEFPSDNIEGFGDYKEEIIKGLICSNIRNINVVNKEEDLRIPLVEGYCYYKGIKSNINMYIKDYGDFKEDKRSNDMYEILTSIKNKNLSEEFFKEYVNKLRSNSNLTREDLKGWLK